VVSTNAQIYSMYLRNRQANNNEMEKILKMISLGAGIKETVDDFNKSTNAKMKPRDFYNYQSKNANPGLTHEQILEGNWLTDREICDFLEILRHQLKDEVKGLENTLIICMLKLKIV
jgi:hypothetical protein